ncbi:MAG TPA: hypothetical protein PLU87_18915 [Sedimentisphaerales bacterium]|nr:hypothetical protein [Sedimentisphaerales bacterium]HRS13159.1 hypothetical protein [Sedimentisphaerales bacterium]HRV49719.1 hypothetical protein [Sedimentisphaerales bacterium]
MVIPPADELALVQDPVATAPPQSSQPAAASAPITAAHRAQEAEARRRERETLEWLGSPPPKPEPTGERKFYWLFDILLYPFSITGIVTMAVIVGFPLVRAFLRSVLPLFGPWRHGAFLLIRFTLGLYVAWYLAECVYDSAKGGTRAPDVLDADTSLGALWSRVSSLLGVYILYGLPVALYAGIARRFDATFWALAAWAVFLFPMALMAMVIYDSPSALNPLFVLNSIRRVCLPYIGLVACLIGMAALFAVLPAMFRPAPPPGAVGAFGLLSLIVGAYGSFIFAHVLGRFYWRYRDRLDWGI